MSLNQWSRGHWSVRKQEATRWALLVRNAARKQRPFTEPVRIQLTFIGARDADNHGKAVLDGIVRAGLIVDDRYPFVSELILRARPGKRKATLVRIEVA